MEIRLSKSSDGGQFWSKANIIASSGQHVSNNGVVVNYDSSGTVHMVYGDYDTVNSKNVVMYYNSYYNTISDITNASGADIENRNMVVSGDDVYITTVESNKLAFVHSSDGGYSFTLLDYEPVYVNFGTGSQPALSNGPDGYAFAAWYNGTTVVNYAIFQNGTVIQTGPITVTSSYDPSIAAKDNNNIYITTGSSGIYLIYTTNGGSSWSQTTVSATGGDASVAVDSAGKVNVAYEDTTGIVFKRGTKSGQNWSWTNPVTVFPVSSCTSASFPNIALDSNGKAGIMAQCDIEGDMIYFSKEQ